MQGDMPAPPPVPDCICYGGQPPCDCTHVERALRAWADRRPMPAMTPDQKGWALAEIASVEGYDATDYADLPDADVARGVLHAWVDYCRDKGLL